MELVGAMQSTAARNFVSGLARRLALEMTGWTLRSHAVADAALAEQPCGPVHWAVVAVYGYLADQPGGGGARAKSDPIVDCAVRC